MTTAANAEIRKAFETFMGNVIKRNPGESEFHQAVREVAHSVVPFTFEHPEYREQKILERMTEPDRIVIFRVSWEDDQGTVRADRAWRIQFNNSIGPYKGGIRFHPSVNQSILKFLGFEQVFKNSLTTLPMGGAKGGANFDPKGKSDREVMRFCQSMMTELYRHVGPYTDVPAGDIGVGGREIGYLFGQYKRLKNQFEGILTGKGLAFGGSLIRTEATGYGTVYFMENMLNSRGDGVRGKTASVSGSGNVAIYTIEKLIEMGAKPVTASDSGGFIHDPAGIDEAKLEWLKELKEVRRGRISEYAEQFGCEYYADARPWGVPCYLAFPCATQNELDGDDAGTLLANGCIAVAEGANMPTDSDGVAVFQEAKIAYGPGKAANAGGVAVSGLEQSQNALRIAWSRDEVDARLKDIMAQIHEKCLIYGGTEDGYVDYVRGANLGGFVKVADALLGYGVV
jgi:glutamate dehydrogenase (NADP+)